MICSASFIKGIVIIIIYAFLMGFYIIATYRKEEKHPSREYYLMRLPIGIAFVLLLLFAYFCGYYSF
jgi:type II secretory pathway component PulF